MFQVLGLRKVKDTEPQEFEVQLRDKVCHDDRLRHTAGVAGETEGRRDARR